MAAGEHYFVEWKELYVSKERGNRVVHYFLKDNSGESILAVVGTERSVRHMFYVVSDEFLSARGADNSVHAGFRWRSRREVVNWLTSMLSKHHRRGDDSMSPRDEPTSEVNAHKIRVSPHKGHFTRTLKGRHLDISWSGASWTCGKQLKHYPEFRRNGISIAVQSFVFIMAEKENRYIAYLEDMYEDRKGLKKVKVRWFHHNREVRGVVSLKNPHPKEVYITPYSQVISAECVDGPAIILTHEHYDKCLAVFPHDLLGRVHFCSRLYKNNRIKPFKVSKLRGYFNQSIFSCFSPDFFEEEEEFSSEGDVKAGPRRDISLRENIKFPYDLSYKKCGPLSGEPNFLKHVEAPLTQTPAFELNEKVEFLSHDSGLRGCWFRCTVLEVSRKKMKILYDDLKDEDSGTNLEEWIPANRVAKADRLGMRHFGRSTVRPAYPYNGSGSVFEVGDPADAWWSDGWWEGVISGTSDHENGFYQIYIPDESLNLNIELKDIRVSRDWLGDQWVDVERNPNILSLMSAASTYAKVSTSSGVSKEVKSDNYSPTSCQKVVANHKLDVVEEEVEELAGMTLTNAPLQDECIDSMKQRAHAAAKENSKPANGVGEDNNGYSDGMRADIDDSSGDNSLVECQITEMKCDDKTMEMLIE